MDLRGYTVARQVPNHGARRACPLGCNHGEPFTDLASHLRTQHFGPGKQPITAAQLASVSFKKCDTCATCYKIGPNGQPLRAHSCGAAARRRVSVPAPTSQELPPSSSTDADVSTILHIAGATAAAAAPDADADDGLAGFEARLQPNDKVLLRKYCTLAQLPVPADVPPSLIRDFIALCTRMADAYIDAPVDDKAERLLDILAIPKISLARLISSAPEDKLVRRIHEYPNIRWPLVSHSAPEPDLNGPDSYDGEETGPDDELPVRSGAIHNRIRKGFLRRAVRELQGTSKVLPVTPEVITKLRSKHPAGTPNPFRDVGPPPFASDLQDDKLDVMTAFRTFKRDTGGGLGGWSQPMLDQALRSDSFMAFVKLLTKQIAFGTAPGHYMLCAARLTPLSKSDGGVRPIAVGELLYLRMGAEDPGVLRTPGPILRLTPADFEILVRTPYSANF